MRAIGIACGVNWKLTANSGGAPPPGPPAGAIQIETGDYLLLEDGSYVESESGIGGKISTYPQNTTPSRSDYLLGIEGGAASKDYTLASILDGAIDMKTFMPRGVRMSGDTLSGDSLGTPSTISHALITTYIPFFVPEACTLTAISAAVTTAQAAATVRLGLYTLTAITGVGAVTGARVADFGTIDVSATGEKTIVVSQAVTRGLYCFCAAVSNHSALRMRRPATSAGMILWGESTAGGTGTDMWLRTGVDNSGALPANIDATSGVVSNTNGAVLVLGTFT